MEHDDRKLLSVVEEEEQEKSILEKLKLSQNFVDKIQVKKKLRTVRIKRPNKQWWIRVRPGAEWRINLALIELRDSGEDTIYGVLDDLYPEVAEEAALKTLFLGITRQGTLFLWPIKLPDSEGKIDSWNESAMALAKTAMEKWIRVLSNREGGFYVAMEPENDLPDPKWPEEGFEEIIAIAFKNNLIDDYDHPVLKQLRGGS
jgi:hypothetical protein